MLYNSENTDNLCKIQLTGLFYKISMLNNLIECCKSNFMSLAAILPILRMLILLFICTKVIDYQVLFTGMFGCMKEKLLFYTFCYCFLLEEVNFCLMYEVSSTYMSIKQFYCVAVIQSRRISDN